MLAMPLPSPLFGSYTALVILGSFVIIYVALSISYYEWYQRSSRQRERASWVYILHGLSGVLCPFIAFWFYHSLTTYYEVVSFWFLLKMLLILPVIAVSLETWYQRQHFGHIFIAGGLLLLALLGASWIWQTDGLGLRHGSAVDRGTIT